MSIKKDAGFQSENLFVPVLILLAFWCLAIWGFIILGNVQLLILLGFIGTYLGFGLGVYTTLSPKK